MRLYYKFVFALIFIFCLAKKGNAQPVLTQIPNLPSIETYDLFTDSKGFLWVANNAGIFRYDGISFTNFSNPLQSSLSATGLMEDKHGRIWLNNFTGQIFYIENGRMKLLKAYLSKYESSFPRLGIFKNLLIATTDKGLFTCNLDNFECKYITCNNPAVLKGTTSLTILHNRVIAYGNGNWFTYTPGTGLQLITLNKAENDIIKTNASTLTVQSYKDTLFMLANPASLLYKLYFEGNTLKICQKQHFNSFINTVSVSNNYYLVNTTTESFDSRNKATLKNYDISSLATDQYGRTWYGSLQKGLLTGPGAKTAIDTPAITVAKNNLIQTMASGNGILFLGTNMGDLFKYDISTQKLSLLTTLPTNHGGINYLYATNNKNIIISSAVNSYQYNIAKKQLILMDSIKTLKQVDTFSNHYLFASARGLYIFKQNNFGANKKADTGYNYNTFYKYCITKQRCRAVCYMATTKTIWVSLKNGLYMVKPNGGIVPFNYLNDPVFASCLTSTNNKLIIGTFNNGLIIKQNNTTRHISVDNGLLSNHIVGVEVHDKHLWVFTTGSVQLLDVDTYKILNIYNIPGKSDAFINDIEEWDGKCYLATLKGINRISANKMTGKPSINIYLSKINVNGRDTDAINNLKLKNNQNNLEIELAVPLVQNSNDVLIKYRLSNGDRSQWSFSDPGERSFHFSSLMPGKYIFEASAGYPQTGVYVVTYRYNFEILPAWYQTWWFMIYAVLALITLLLGVVRVYYLNILNKQKILFEKELAINAERNRISGEMHDDIGAGLSAIKLYTSTLNADASLQADTDVNLIYNMVNNLSDKIKEVIWSLNSDYDLLENLLYFIQANGHRLFDHSPTCLKIKLPDNIPAIKVSGICRRNIYLIVKEALHNTLKHSKASEAWVHFNITNLDLNIIIGDNGVGISDIQTSKIPTGMGLLSMQNRIATLNGTLTMQSQPGIVINITIPLSEFEE